VKRRKGVKAEGEKEEQRKKGLKEKQGKDDVMGIP
jgi:hypothetical protein